MAQPDGFREDDEPHTDVMSEDATVGAFARPMLATLDPTQAGLVLSLLQPVERSAGEALFEAGQPADGMYLVLQGELTVTGADGSTRRYELGDWLGAAALLDDAPRSETARATRSCRLMHLSAASLELLASREPETWGRLVARVGRVALEVARAERRAAEAERDRAREALATARAGGRRAALIVAGVTAACLVALGGLSPGGALGAALGLLVAALPALVAAALGRR